MIIKHPGHSASHAKGVTLVEILIVLGVLVVLMSFAVPSVSNATIKAEMSVAVENVQYSLQMARKTARVTESPLVLHISPLLPDAPQKISFKAPDGGNLIAGVQIQDFTLPGEIVLVSEQESFVFDRRGLVENPGSVSLVSKDDESVTSTIEVR